MAKKRGSYTFFLISFQKVTFFIFLKNERNVQKHKSTYNWKQKLMWERSGPNNLAENEEKNVVTTRKLEQKKTKLKENRNIL